MDRADVRYDEDGKAGIPTDFKKQETLVYSEYGLTNTTTFVVQTGYQSVNLPENGLKDSYDGLGETTIGMRQLLWSGDKSVLSGQVSWVFGSDSELVSDAPLGFGSAHPEFRVLYGYSLNIAGKETFVDVQGAYHLRKKTEPDDWRLDITGGVKPWGKSQVLLQGFYVQTEKFQDFPRRNERFKLQASWLYDWRQNTRFQIGAYSNIAGKNTIKEEGFFFGIWSQF